MPNGAWPATICKTLPRWDSPRYRESQWRNRDYDASQIRPHVRVSFKVLNYLPLFPVFISRALNFFSGCVRHPIRHNCGLEAWQVIFRVLKDTTKTLMPACQFTGTSPKVIHNKNHVKTTETTRPNIIEQQQVPDTPAWGANHNPETERHRNLETEKPNSRRAKEKPTENTAKYSQLEAKQESEMNHGLLTTPSLLLICFLALYTIFL